MHGTVKLTPIAGLLTKERCYVSPITAEVSAMVVIFSPVSTLHIGLSVHTISVEYSELPR